MGVTIGDGAPVTKCMSGAAAASRGAKAKVVEEQVQSRLRVSGIGALGGMPGGSGRKKSSWKSSTSMLTFGERFPALQLTANPVVETYLAQKRESGKQITRRDLGFRFLASPASSFRAPCSSTGEIWLPMVRTPLLPPGDTLSRAGRRCDGVRDGQPPTFLRCGWHPDCRERPRD